LILTPNKKNAARINKEKLEALPGPYHLSVGELKGEFIKKQHKILPAPFELRLKVGAQVMFVKNDINRRWVNGTVGVVVDIQEGEVSVEVIKKGRVRTYQVEKDVWKEVKYRYDPIDKRIIAEEVGTYIQYPLMPAWAVTIHKSQGRTLDEVVIDMDFGAFADGQLYVALSRSTTLDGISLVKPLEYGDVKCDTMIKRFYEFLRVSDKINIRDESEDKEMTDE